MKKVLTILLSLALMFTLTACGGKATTESSAPEKSGKSSSGEVKSDKIKYYGIGETVDVDDGFEITIDKVEIIDDLSIFQQYSEGYVYIKVYATAKISLMKNKIQKIRYSALFETIIPIPNYRTIRATGMYGILKLKKCILRSTSPRRNG